jgi:hypothetical protein
MPQPNTMRLHEHVRAGGRVDRERGIIFGVKVIGRESKNGREYSEAALRGAIPMYENTQVFIDHDDRRSGPSTRKTSDLFGSLRSVRFEDGAVKADLHFLKSHPLAGQIMEAAERHPNLLGMSHHAEGNVARRGGKLIVESIGKVHSVDIVTQPATNSGLFEQETNDTPGEILTNLESVVDQAVQALVMKVRAGDPRPTAQAMARFIGRSADAQQKFLDTLKVEMEKVGLRLAADGDGETAASAVEPPEGSRPGNQDTQESLLRRQVFGGQPAGAAKLSQAPSSPAGIYDELREAVFGKPR